MVRILEVIKEALRDYRDLNDLTDQQLASRIGVSPATLCRWLNGETKTISEEKLERVLEKIGLTRGHFDRLFFIDVDAWASINGSTDGHPEVLVETCNVGSDTASLWLTAANFLVRADLYEKLEAHQAEESLPIDCREWTFEEAAAWEAKRDGGDGGNAPRATPAGLALAAETFAHGLIVRTRRWYEDLVHEGKGVELVGKVKGTKSVRGAADGTGTTTVVTAVDSVQDGDHIAVEDGDELVIGTLRFIPVLVMDDSGGETEQE